MEDKNIKVVCFGEILWDNLPGGRKPGGAPMNVAYHLNQLGIISTLISKVGSDQNGEDLLKFINKKGISTEYCQTDMMYNTSTVEVNIGSDHEVSYEIVSPVAWDFILPEKRMDQLVAAADAFVFGSLAVRNPTSFKTLQSLLKASRYRVFDVNLREPHFTKETITILLQHADLLKLNSHELNLISSWFGNSQNERQMINMLQERFGIKEIVVTKGANGAAYYSKSEQFTIPAFKVEINDTIGSGDSFLAAFLGQKLKGQSVQDCLISAAALGAFVASQPGACPDYNISDLNRFISQNEFDKNSFNVDGTCDP
ncbi:MAG: carbohydrate kinase [Daejeonella sp.]|uniref:carbohydrate kinase family protein n=1 Tax=Daejeonella sp. TaxID=2805397 RepID=UPI003C76112E